MDHIFLLFTCYSGEKKKHRKEMIAVKRRDRMLRRGVDLEQINSVCDTTIFHNVVIQIVVCTSASVVLIKSKL